MGVKPHLTISYKLISLHQGSFSTNFFIKRFKFTPTRQKAELNKNFSLISKLLSKIQENFWLEFSIELI